MTTIAELPEILLDKVTGLDLKGQFAQYLNRTRSVQRQLTIDSLERYQELLNSNQRGAAWLFIPRSVRRALKSEAKIELKASVLAFLGFEQLQLMIDPDTQVIYARTLGPEYDNWELISDMTELPVNFFQYLYYLDGILHR